METFLYIVALISAIATLSVTLVALVIYQRALAYKELAQDDMIEALSAMRTSPRRTRKPRSTHHRDHSLPAIR